MLLFFFRIYLQRRLPRPKDQIQQTLQAPSHPPTRSSLRQHLWYCYYSFDPCNRFSALQFFPLATTIEIQPPKTTTKFWPSPIGSFANPSETIKYSLTNFIFYSSPQFAVIRLPLHRNKPEQPSLCLAGIHLPLHSQKPEQPSIGSSILLPLHNVLSSICNSSPQRSPLLSSPK